MYGKIVYKWRPKTNISVLFSYGFEPTAKIRHYFGIGFGLPLPDFINDLLFEFNDLDNFRFTFSNLTNFGKK
jgi:hypothetical protein